MNKKTAISPTRDENYAQWYLEVVKQAQLAEHAPVRGCMVIKPWGYAIWENMQKILDAAFKKTGHQNIYCPLFIPKSYLEKEAEHVEGFAKECAVVTHTRLEKDSEGKLALAGELEEPLVIRPTSEAIIGEVFSRWVQSYRDLPILVNQWANVVRWEMRTRMFLRTSEFLWQEGHTAHISEKEAQAESLKMLDIYHDFATNYLAMPVIKGEKSSSERFPGALNTYCIEGMMQDKKALQAGTSHFLGQNFAKAFDIRYTTKAGDVQHAWTTSWGVSTRLVGGLIMTHSDDDGLVLPPRIAPLHVVIMPVQHKSIAVNDLMQYCEKLAAAIAAVEFDGEKVKVKLDDDFDMRPGDKAWSWVKKGVPIRLEIGPRELEKNTVFMGRRDQPYKERCAISANEFVETVSNILTDMQNTLHERALSFRKQHTVALSSTDDFKEFFTNGGGFATAYWHDPNIELEDKLKHDFKVSIRCFPAENTSQEGAGEGGCLFTQKPGRRAIFAKAY